MATQYSQTPQLPQYQSDVPLDLVLKIGTMKEQQYLQNQANIQQRINKLEDYPISKESDRQYLSTRMDEMVSKMNELSGQDLGDSKVYNQILGLSSGFYNDPKVYSKIAANMADSKEQQRIKKIQEDNPELYNDLNFMDFQEHRNKWLANPENDNYSARYTPYTDVTKKLNEIAKDVLAHPDTVREVSQIQANNYSDPIKGERLIEQVTAQKLRSAYQAGLTPTEYNQLRINYNQGYSKGLSAEGTVRELNDMRDRSIATISSLEEQAANSTISSTLKSQLQSNLGLAKEQLNTINNYINQVSSTGNPLLYHNFDLYVDNILSSNAQSKAYRKEGKLDINPLDLKYLDHKLDLDKLAIKQQYDLELEAAKQSKNKTAQTSGNKYYDVKGNPLVENEFIRGVGDIQRKGEGTLNPIMTSKLINGTYDDKDGSIYIVMDGKNQFIDLQPYLDPENVKNVVSNKVLEDYNKFRNSPQGEVNLYRVYDPKTGDRVIRRADQYLDKKSGEFFWSTVPFTDVPIPEGSVKKSFTEWLNMMNTTPANSNDRAIKEWGRQIGFDFSKQLSKDPQSKVNSSGQVKTYTDLYKEQNNIDLRDSNVIKVSQELEKNPTLQNESARLSALLKDKSLKGKQKFYTGGNSNVVSGTDGQMYVKGYIELPEEEYDSYFEGLGLAKSGLVKEVERGEQKFYQIPTTVKVTKDLLSAQTEYQSDEHTDSYTKENAYIYQEWLVKNQERYNLVKNYIGKENDLILNSEGKVKHFKDKDVREFYNSSINLAKQAIKSADDNTYFNALKVLSDIYSKSEESLKVDLNAVKMKNSEVDISTKTNNPGNMIYHPWMQQYGATPSGIKQTDGSGIFARFPNPQAGLKAYQTQLFGDTDNIFSSNYYKANTSVDTALKTWSNNGYGVEIYPELRGKTLGQLSQQERNELTKRQIRRESPTMFNLLTTQGIL